MNITSPQALQWCLRLTTVNFRSHRMQLLAASSGIQYGCNFPRRRSSNDSTQSESNTTYSLFFWLVLMCHKVNIIIVLEVPTIMLKFNYNTVN